jgi:hypothetical protein
MKIHEFISLIARCETSRELSKRLTDDAVAEDAVETMDKVVCFARDMEKAGRAPTANFVDGDWSFRYATDTRGGAHFTIFPKGQRSHWSSRGSLHVASDGKTWMYTIYHNGSGVADARPSFAEAKDEVLRLLARPER